MDSSRATLIEGASQREELEEQLLRAEHNLKRFYQEHPVREIDPPGEKLPPRDQGWSMCQSVLRMACLHRLSTRRT
jgi:hypothetical protein